MQDVDHFVWRDPFAGAPDILDLIEVEVIRARIKAFVYARVPKSGPTIASLSLLFKQYGGPTLSRIPDNRLAELEVAVIRFSRDLDIQ